MRRAGVVAVLLAMLGGGGVQGQKRPAGAEVRMAQAMIELGYAQAIEAACPGHVKTLDVEINMIAFGTTLGADATLALVRAAMEEAAREFRLREDRPGFCGRILTAHGPGSRHPLVRHGTPSRQ